MISWISIYGLAKYSPYLRYSSNHWWLMQQKIRLVAVSLIALFPPPEPAAINRSITCKFMCSFYSREIQGESVCLLPDTRNLCMPGSLTSGFLWSRCRGKRSRYSRRIRNPQFCLSDKKPIEFIRVEVPRLAVVTKTVGVTYLYVSIAGYVGMVRSNWHKWVHHD